MPRIRPEDTGRAAGHDAAPSRCRTRRPGTGRGFRRHRGLYKGEASALRPAGPFPCRKALPGQGRAGRPAGIVRLRVGVAARAALAFEVGSPVRESDQSGRRNPSGRAPESPQAGPGASGRGAPPAERGRPGPSRRGGHPGRLPPRHLRGSGLRADNPPASPRYMPGTPLFRAVLPGTTRGGRLRPPPLPGPTGLPALPTPLPAGRSPGPGRSLPPLAENI